MLDNDALGGWSEETLGLVPAAKDIQEVFGKERVETQRFGCIMDTLIERDDVIRARLVGQVEDPGVSGIAQARPVKTTGVVHDAHRSYVQSGLKGADRPPYALLYVRVAYDPHQLAEVIVADGERGLTGRDGADRQGARASGIAGDGGDDDHGVQHYEGRSHPSLCWWASRCLRTSSGSGA